MLESSPTYFEWDKMQRKEVEILRRRVEAVRKKAVSSLCNYSHPSAYVHLRATELEEVCSLALSSFPVFVDVEQTELFVD